MLSRGAAQLLCAAKTAFGGQQAPTPPLKLSGTSASIATLLWQVSSKEGVLEKVQDEMHQLLELFREHEPLRRLAIDPFVPLIVRKKVIESVLKDSGATEIVKRLMGSLADENALSAILQVTKSFDELMLAYKKEVYCTVITAMPLDKLERTELRKKAEEFVEPGFKLVTQEKVDRKLLGGFILEFEDRRVDLSIAKKNEEFNALVSKLEADLN
ncbi:MAG: hypothetical protein WDW36_010218 [Sanguina aurantia]